MNRLAFRCLPFLLAGAVHLSAQTEPADRQKNVLSISPIMLFLVGPNMDFPVMNVGYERELGMGISVKIPLYAGYFESKNEGRDFAFGGGLGIRKYVGRPFSGSYIALQSEYVAGESQERDFDGISDVLRTESHYLSITQLAYGYKWQWRTFSLDLSGGGAFYASDDYKQTTFIGNVTLGFPFSKETFGF